MNNWDFVITSERITYICELLFSILRVPISVVDNSGKLIIKHTLPKLHNPLVTSPEELYRQLFPVNATWPQPTIACTKYYENYFSVSVGNAKTSVGKIIVGPSIFSSINQATIDIFFRDFKIPANFKSKLVQYYSRIPIMNANELRNASRLLSFMLYQKKTELASLSDTNFSSQKKFDIETDFEAYLLEKKKNSQFRFSLQYEQAIMQAVKEGNKDKLLKHLEKPLDGEIAVLSKNPLRNQKNHFISFVTFISHAAIGGGLDWELAFSLSDIYIQQVEELTDIKDIYALSKKMLLDYTDKVQKLQNNSHSKSIIKSMNYINKHLYEKLSIPEIAEYTGINASYLSQLFRKQAGISISKYIQIKKIAEAKKLLLDKSSILNVSVLLGFNDQSYFTKVFKECTGITPKEYKQSSNS